MSGTVVVDEFVWYGVHVVWFFFLMIRRPPRSTQSRSSAASDVYKRQVQGRSKDWSSVIKFCFFGHTHCLYGLIGSGYLYAVSYTHLRAHETPEHLVCRLLLEKKKNHFINSISTHLPLRYLP